MRLSPLPTSPDASTNTFETSPLTGAATDTDVAVVSPTTSAMTGGFASGGGSSGGGAGGVTAGCGGVAGGGVCGAAGVAAALAGAAAGAADRVVPQPANIHQPRAIPPPVTSAVSRIQRIGERAAGGGAGCAGGIGVTR